MGDAESKLIEMLVAVLANERKTIDLYKQIYRKICAYRNGSSFDFESFEKEIRQTIVEKEWHKAELSGVLETLR